MLIIWFVITYAARFVHDFPQYIPTPFPIQFPLPELAFGSQMEVGRIVLQYI